jgi:hypothetical protein
MDLARIDDPAHCDGVEHVRETTDMVFVRMRGYQKIQVSNAELTKAGSKGRPG